MPATTPIYGLPYQVGTDPPCFGPGTGCDNLESVWCDFAALVEAQLDENDLVIGRTAVSSPLAEIAILRGQGFDPLDPSSQGPDGDFPNGYVPYDIIVADTDNIVVQYQTFPGDTGSTILALSPRRDGIYQVEASIRYFQGGTAEVPSLIIESGAQLGSTGNVDIIAFGSSRSAVGEFSDVRASAVYQFSSSTGPFPRSIRVNLAGTWTADTAVVSSRLAVYWHSDL